MHLLDVNVWLSLAFDSHEHHPPARSWFLAREVESCCFCRVTQQGFLRLATTPRVLSRQALSQREAWQAYDAICGDPRVVYADEPEGIEPLWRRHTQRDTYSPRVWTDAYLAAFAQAADLELVTFDRGLAETRGPRCTLLT